MGQLAIRRARPEDAETACRIIKRSVIELCTADHQDNPAQLSEWLGNKTPENFILWLQYPGNTMLVATQDDGIQAVGLVNREGSIALNYVSPDARFRGISRAMLCALEARAHQSGCQRCTVTATKTAHQFYRANGYKDEGLAIKNSQEMLGYCMSKILGTALPE